MYSTGYNSLCIIVDQLLKYVYFVLCAEMISAKGLSQFFLYTIIARYGMHHRIISYLDPRFTLRFCSALVSALGCEHAKSSSHHPGTDR